MSSWLFKLQSDRICNYLEVSLDNLIFFFFLFFPMFTIFVLLSYIYFVCFLWTLCTFLRLVFLDSLSARKFHSGADLTSLIVSEISGFLFTPISFFTDGLTVPSVPSHTLSAEHSKTALTDKSQFSKTNLVWLKFFSWKIWKNRCVCHFFLEKWNFSWQTSSWFWEKDQSTFFGKSARY